MALSRLLSHRVALVALILVLVTGAALTAWRLQPSPVRSYAPAGPGDVYLALGDSLPWGAQLADPAVESYPALIHDRLDNIQPIELVNLAVPGETSASFVRRQLPQAVELITRARAADQQVSPITVSIGGNDLISVERGTPAERAAAITDFERNLVTILAELRRAAGPQADIAVMTYYNPSGGDPAAENSDAAWVAQLNATITAVATPRGVTVADVYTPFAQGGAYAYTYILIGDVHANAQGHLVIAEQFWQALGY